MIAILAVLLAILLPALAVARRNGRAVTSLSNLRSLAQATAMYQLEHKSLYPKPAEGTFRGLGDLTPDERVAALWYNALDPYLGERTPPDTAAEREKRNNEQWKQSPVWKDFSADDQAKTRSFKMNANFANDGAGRYQTSEAQVKQPSRVVLYGDGQAADSVNASKVNQATFALSEGLVAPRWSGAAHLVFADGHANPERQPLNPAHVCPAWFGEKDKRGGVRTIVWDFAGD